MSAATIEVTVPTTIMDYGIKPDTIERLVNEWLVVDLFTRDIVSSGKAASLLNISRVDFLDLLRQKRIAYLDYDMDELQDEIATLNSLKIDRAQ